MGSDECAMKLWQLDIQESNEQSAVEEYIHWCQSTVLTREVGTVFTGETFPASK